MKELRLTTKVINETDSVIISFETIGYDDCPSDILEICGLLDNAKAIMLKKLGVKYKVTKNE